MGHLHRRRASGCLRSILTDRRPWCSPISRRNGDAAHVVGRDTADRLTRYRLEPGDILVVRSAQTDPAIVTGSPGRMLMGNNLIRLRVRDITRTDPDYLLAWLSSTRGKADILAATTGSVVPTLSKQALGNLTVTLPPIAEQRRIGAAMRAVDDQVADLRALADAADKARVSLVNGLVTGVARLKEAPGLGNSPVTEPRDHHAATLGVLASKLYHA
ncbi:restriction endonuclease subunit S [Nocardia sp. NPDC059764]|uniref:restriction endonuclease subunit S n=1 Tax=Nocardia sp. NPDC059764 TaxID=3346939 RepID=UPI0036520FC4